MRFKKIVLTVIITCLTEYCVKSQPISGTTGLLNTPSGRMQHDGTLMFGANYMPKGIAPKSLNYNTGNYFFNITFLPFIEVNYRLTLLSNHGIYNLQDRSFDLRGQFLKEKRFFPSLVIGAKDVYTSITDADNQYFGSIYIVASKSVACKLNEFDFTMGYGLKALRNNEYIGLFGGVSFSPGFLDPLNLIAEYDSESFNTGASFLFLKHVSLVVFVCAFKDIAGGVAYKIFL